MKKSNLVQEMKRTVRISHFPKDTRAEAVKKFLEKHTGHDTIEALKIRVTKRNSVVAIVQFITSDCIDTLEAKMSVLNRLQIEKLNRDIIPNPRTSLFTLDNAFLSFGWLVSEKSFLYLWGEDSVQVKFGFGLRKIHLFLSHNGHNYKLEISYEGIWQIQHSHPKNEDTDSLIFQLQESPKIFKEQVPTTRNVYDDPSLNYFRQIPDEQWIRTTDFTSMYSIGQSSSLCLIFRRNWNLPKFGDKFVYFKENANHLHFERGSPFCKTSDLVPIINSPREVIVPFSILFKINYLVQNGYLVGPTLDASFFKLVNPNVIPLPYIERALENLSHLKDACFEPSPWLLDQYKKYSSSKYPFQSPSISLEPGLLFIRRVQITPSKIYFCGPEINVSNRVLRNYDRYIDNFIRVSFVDEDFNKMRSMDLSRRTNAVLETNEGRTDIYKRILETLRNGIIIGDKKFEFLAFSSSQLRENSAWMFASEDGHTANSIRRWMGNFSNIKNVAKYAARLGQSFSSSTESLTVEEDEVEIIDDIEIISSSGVKYNFSDGIGKISPSFAAKVAKKCGIENVPSAFQIRYGGFKGVVAVDQSSTSKKLYLRKSMRKYESDNRKLDVLSWSKYQPCYLNRQLITLLSTLDVKDDVFLIKQQEAVEQLKNILSHPLEAYQALEMMAPGENTNVLKEMLRCGYEPRKEPYLLMMLQNFQESTLLQLRTRTRIFNPNGRSMMGCLDETGILQYGQVFIQISRAGSSGGNTFFDRHRLLDRDNLVLERRVIVTKNPCLHPGDVRVLVAVDIPELHHMIDCVVFPQRGKRPHPNECSGSDLDGDVYFVSWDPELLPPRQLDPADYSPPPTATQDHDVTIEEIQEYFANYMVNDSLGVIANAHTVFADREASKALSLKCLDLAKLFSIAVDFPKTGVAAEIPSHLQVRQYPDFMEKLDKDSYESKGVIGKLFREVKDVSQFHNWKFTRDSAVKYYDKDMEVEGFIDYLDDAFWCKEQYDFKLGNLMDYYGIKTEAEILSGHIKKMGKTFTRNKDADAIRLAVRSLKKEVRAWFNEKDDAESYEDVYKKASAWYHVTYSPDYWGLYDQGMGRPHFISFPWCIFEKLILIKQRQNKEREMTDGFKRKLRLGLQTFYKDLCGYIFYVTNLIILLGGVWYYFLFSIPE